MLGTPKPNRFRPSLGEPSRVSRLRAQSPGGSSVDSLERLSTASPRQRRATTASPHRRNGTSLGNAMRATGRGGAIVRNSRDPRPVGDRGFATQCARNVVDVLTSRNYGKSISYEKLLKDPSTKEFFDVFRFLVAQIDPQLEIDGKMEDEVPAIMRRLKYPVEVNRSKLQAISGPNTWPQLLAVLDWLSTLVRITEELIGPVAACQLGLGDDDEDHQVLRSLHENYLGYLGGRDDHSDEEHLRQIYEERINALRGEIERLQGQSDDMTQRCHDFQSEHDRLLELQKAPVHLEMEADRLRTVIQQQESRVQHMEDQMSRLEVDERERNQELEGLQITLRRLTEQVEGQAYSKKDIERLKCERGHLQSVMKDLRTDSEKADQDVWELGMQESKRAENIGRLVRQVNGTAESLENALRGEESGINSKDLRLRVDLNEPSDALAAQDFDELRAQAQASAAAHTEVVQFEEAAMHDLMEEQRVVQEELSEREREGRRLKARLEQLNRMREEYREWSAVLIDDAERTAEGTEDALHQASVGLAAPSLRDVAEVDKLRLAITAVRTQGQNEQTQLQEQIRRDEERFEEHRQHVLRELDSYAKATEALAQDVEASLEDGSSGQVRRTSRVARGGC